MTPGGSVVDERGGIVEGFETWYDVAPWTLVLNSRTVRSGHGLLAAGGTFRPNTPCSGLGPHIPGGALAALLCDSVQWDT